MSKRQRLAWWLSLPVLIALLGVAWQIGRAEPEEPWPVLCLHADGKVTLDGFEGRVLSRSDLQVIGKRTNASQPCLTLKPAPGLPIEAWFDAISATCEGGIGYYQFRSGAKKLAFHVPGSAPPSDSSSPQIIDLLDGAAEEEGPEDIWDPSRPLGSDVHVIFKRSMSFEELYDAIAPNVRPGVSMVIANPRFYFMRTRDEDEQHLPPRQPSLWERLKEKVTTWVK